MVPEPEVDGHRRPNAFAGGRLDRAAERRADPDWLAERRSDPDSRVIPVWRSRNLVVEGAEVGYDPVYLSPQLASEVSEASDEWWFLGLDDGRAIFAADVSAEFAEAPPLAELGAFHDIQKIGAMLGQEDGSLLAYARAVASWTRRHRFCGTCGHPTAPTQGGHVRRCGNELCETDHFPRTDPAIIVLVADGDRCLLGRKQIWPDGVYSTLAGFVEPGESLSEAVAREVREESGIEVASVRYRSSQPWPFPASLMLGFHAVATGGALAVNREELEDVRWFERSELLRRKEQGLRLPRRVSIARRLIEEWLAADAP